MKENAIDLRNHTYIVVVASLPAGNRNIILVNLFITAFISLKKNHMGFTISFPK